MDIDKMMHTAYKAAGVGKKMAACFQKHGTTEVENLQCAKQVMLDFWRSPAGHELARDMAIAMAGAIIE